MSKKYSDLIRKHFTYRDGDLLWRVPTSNRVKIGTVAGCADGNGYKTVRFMGRCRMLHRVIWDYHYDSCEGFLVDHIDRDPSNNRIENLRLCSYSQNAANSEGHKDSKIPFKGVHVHYNGRYRAQIRHKGKRIHLGVFDTAEEAHLAYVAAGKRLNGAFFTAGKTPEGGCGGKEI